jgi:hypothetical protein
MPRACGIVQSVFVAIHGMPPSSSGTFSANAASASCVHPTSGAKPCTTAAGESSALRVMTKPAFSTSSTRPSPPTTSTVDPGAMRCASRRMAACGLVTTSSAVVGRPSCVRCAATEASVREALFVM